MSRGARAVLCVMERICKRKTGSGRKRSMWRRKPEGDNHDVLFNFILVFNLNWNSFTARLCSSFSLSLRSYCMPTPLEPYDDYRSEGSTILVFLVVLSNSRSYVVENLRINSWFYRIVRKWQSNLFIFALVSGFKLVTFFDEGINSSIFPTMQYNFCVYL